VTRLAERLVEAHHVDAAEFMHLMTMGGSSATPPRAPRRTAALGMIQINVVARTPPMVAHAI
jgi:hypothetical protein